VTESGYRYIRVWRSKVDVGKVNIIHTTSLSIRIIGSFELLEITINVCPGIDAHTEHKNGECEEDNAADQVCARSVLICISL
jgi:hypothetical protein